MNKLPLSSLSYWFALISCFLFIFGGFALIFAISSLALTIKAQRQYDEAPNGFTNISKVKKARVIAIIGIVLNLVILGITIWTLMTVGWDAWSEEFIRRWNEGLESSGRY